MRSANKARREEAAEENRALLSRMEKIKPTQSAEGGSKAKVTGVDQMMLGEEGHKAAAEESNHGKGDVQMDGDDDMIDKENNAAMVNNTHINANS